MAGNGNYSENVEDIDPAVRHLCQVLNATGLISTKYSCQGHPWIPFISTPSPPYVCFAGSPQIAAVVAQALADAWYLSELRFRWEVDSSWLYPEEAIGKPTNEDGQPFEPVLRWSIKPPALWDAVWFSALYWGKRRDIDHDFAWMVRHLPAVIRAVAI